MPTSTIVFVHGNFVTRHSWDRWLARFEARGYECISIAYPGRDKPVAELKQNPNDPFLGKLSLKDVLDHHIRTIQALPEKPLLIGHSFGGLLTQLLLQRDLAVAGITIDSVPPQGVIPLNVWFYRATWPIVNPFIPASRPFYMTFPHFQRYFANELPEAEQRPAYDADMVPESRRMSRGALSSTARVDFKRPHAPLLLIAGEKDHIMPASLNRQNYRRYSKSPSTTEFKEFAGRCHYTIIAGKGWEEVADYALGWAERQQLLRPSSADGLPAMPRVPADSGQRLTAGG